MLKWSGGVILIVLIKFKYSQADVTCPCVSGTWTYQGDTYSYCANPNGAKTDWCPTQLNDDGSYTSNLPFSFCEADVYTACTATKEDNPVTCPCAADWKYKGDSYTYCADPNNGGFEWCATETDDDGNYAAGKYAKCTTAIAEACEVAEEAAAVADAVADTSGCPCISGGQWSFDGERQSYCQQPNGIGRKPWCPRSTAEVTSDNMGSVSIAYCNNKILRKCKELEGTRLPTQCPCVEGGQWKYKGKDRSYCEDTNFCATEVDDDGNFMGKGVKCKKKAVRAACHKLHLLTSEQGKEDLFGDYTQTNTGCPCWFDLTRSDCACCTDDGVQCGAPMQGWCTSKKEGRVSGCLGIPANHWTLSTTGYPCYWNTSRTDCAWCAPGGAQCGPAGDTGPDSAQGSRCWDANDASYCDSVPGNCLHIDHCDSEAECKFNVKFGSDREHHTCQCKTGWTGNGIQCYDSDGNPSEVSVSSGDVKVTLAVTNDYYVYPHNSSEFPLGPGETSLLSNISALFEAGASCAATQSCNGTYANLEETPVN